jgi:hypothetical protein
MARANDNKVVARAIIGFEGGTQEQLTSGNRETIKYICGASSWQNLVLN